MLIVGSQCRVPFEVRMYLNFAAESAVRQLWDEIGRCGITRRDSESHVRPHLTFAVYEDVSEAVFVQRLQIWAADVSPFVITMSSIGVFCSDTSELFLGITATRELLNLHCGFHTTFKDLVWRPWAYYLPDCWIPHCTLAGHLSPSQTANALEACLHVVSRITGMVESVELTRIHPEESSASFELMGMHPLVDHPPQG